MSRESETDVDSRPMDRVTQQPQQHQIHQQQQQQSDNIDREHQLSDPTQTELTPESDKSSGQVSHIFKYIHLSSLFSGEWNLNFVTC